MSVTTTQRRTGQPVELGRYKTPTGERTLIGRRIDGEVHVFDCPCSGSGRRYFVEAGFGSKAELAFCSLTTAARRSASAPAR